MKILIKKLLHSLYAVLKSYLDQGNSEFPCIESTVEFSVGNYLVRAWINQDKLVDGYDDAELKDLAFLNKDEKLHIFVRKLLTYSNINAVHVRDITKDNDGVVVYVNWP